MGETGPTLTVLETRPLSDGLKVLTVMCLYLFMPAFIYGFGKGFLMSGRKYPSLPYFVIPILLFISIGYFAICMIMQQKYGLRRPTKTQVITWFQRWFAIYLVMQVVTVARLGTHRSHWLIQIQIFLFLFLITLPLAAWFPRRLREKVNEGLTV